MGKVCCYTGHRPKKFPFQYNERHPDCIKLKSFIKAETEKTIQRGYDLFVHRAFWNDFMPSVYAFCCFKHDTDYEIFCLSYIGSKLAFIDSPVCFVIIVYLLCRKL